MKRGQSVKFKFVHVCNWAPPLIHASCGCAIRSVPIILDAMYLENKKERCAVLI